MGFSHACFISYRNSHMEKTVTFIEQFVDALENCLDQYIPHDVDVYIDRDRLKAGYKFNIAITKALRESLCMVAILSPNYFNSEYCRREYVAMEHIEEKRRQKVRLPPEEKGLVIPVLVWGAEEDLPREIRDNTQFIAMPFKLTNLRGEIKHDPNLSPIVEKIGDLIREHYRSFADGGHCQTAVNCCASINLPNIANIGMWKKPADTPQPFPGRVPTGAN